jgi:hypothetical protein
MNVHHWAFDHVVTLPSNPFPSMYIHAVLGANIALAIAT